LLQLAQGNPGKLVMFVDLIAESRFWRTGRVLTASVNNEAMILVLDHYLLKEGER
jgi:hypothetical protein